MKQINRLVFALAAVLLFIIVVLWRNNANPNTKSNAEISGNPYTIIAPFIKQEKTIAVVVCGNRTKETLTMLKSALIFSKEPLHFYILADDDATLKLRNRLEDWQIEVSRTFSFEIRPVEFPPGEFHNDWKKLFKPCASQRLFLPSLLKEVDSVLYVDTDTLFLGPVDQVWNHFYQMNESQIAALAPEHENANIGWYNRFAKHPFYKPLGVNTGVMLMNLTRMRTFGWESYIAPIYKQYKTNIPWGDQDIINIIFSFHPDKLYIYGCEFNYRADHCMYTSVCKSAENEGIIVLHGSRGIFHNDKHPTFRSVYKAMEDYKWSEDVYNGLFLKLKSYINATPESQCGIIKNAFLKNLEKYVQNMTEAR